MLCKGVVVTHPIHALSHMAVRGLCSDCSLGQVFLGRFKLQTESLGQGHASMLCLGMPHVSKSDEFSEKFQTAFDPPPHFRKVILRISRQNCDKSAYVHLAGLLCIREHLIYKRMFSFGHCPNYLSPPSPSFGQLVHLFRPS